MTTEKNKMNFTEKENTRDASSCFFSPRRIDMLTEAPVAIIFEIAVTIIMIGIIIFIAASASSPKYLPTNIPSTTEYSAPNTDVITAGTAHLKNSFVGACVAKSSEFILPPKKQPGLYTATTVKKPSALDT